MDSFRTDPSVQGCSGSLMEQHSPPFSLSLTSGTPQTVSRNLQRFFDDTAIVVDSYNMAPVNIQGFDIERVRTWKCLGLQCNNKLDWTGKTQTPVIRKVSVV